MDAAKGAVTDETEFKMSFVPEQTEQKGRIDTEEEEWRPL